MREKVEPGNKSFGGLKGIMLFFKEVPMKTKGRKGRFENEKRKKPQKEGCCLGCHGRFPRGFANGEGVPVPKSKTRNIPLGFIKTVGESAEVNGMTADDDEVLEV